jgi:hypothetical protein
MQREYLVRFVKASQPYNAGETAMFPAGQARRLVGMRVADYVTPPPGYDEVGNRIRKDAEGLRHNGGGWYELVNFIDPDTEAPYRVHGKALAEAKLKELLAVQDENQPPDDDDANNPDDDDGDAE